MTNQHNTSCSQTSSAQIPSWIAAFPTSGMWVLPAKSGRQPVVMGRTASSGLSSSGKELYLHAVLLAASFCQQAAAMSAYKFTPRAVASTTVEIGILRRVGPRHLPTRRTSPTRRAPTPCTTLYDASYIPDASGPDALYDTVRRVVQCLKQHSAPPPSLKQHSPPPPPSLKQHSAPPLLLSNTLHRGRAVWGL